MGKPAAISISFRIAIYSVVLQLICSSRILLHPFSHGFNSHLLNMEKISRILVEEGHEVSMLIGSKSGGEQSRVPGVKLLYYPSATVETLADPDIVEGIPDMNVAEFIYIVFKQQTVDCDRLLQEKMLLQKLKTEKFDLYLVDHNNYCGRITTDFLDVPTILYSNIGFSNEPDIFAPMLLAHMPTVLGYLTDSMTFFERMQNVVTYILAYIPIHKYMYLSAFDRLRIEHNMNVSLSVADSYTRAQLVMANTEFGIDYPRPLMPNVITVGGLCNEPARALQGDLKYFVETAKDGVIVVSFGAIMARLSKAELLARTFARMPYRFIWRLQGMRPEGLGNNTMLMDWLPQNDLLGHPNTILFISHCGISAVNEAIQHAVPVVAIPLIFDQFHQAAKVVKYAQMGVILSWSSLTDESLTSAITSVVHNDEYKRNALRTSNRVKDQPLSPRKKFLFWVDYLLRNGDAKHLNSAAMFELYWYEYLLLDVVLFLAASVVFFVILLKVTISLLCRCKWSKIKLKTT